MYVLINPGPKEEILQCAHTTWNQLSTIATLEVFGIPTPRTLRPGTPTAVQTPDGKSMVGAAINVNTARRTIVIPRDAREVRLLSDTGGVLRRYYWDAEARAPVEDVDGSTLGTIEAPESRGHTPQPAAAIGGLS